MSPFRIAGFLVSLLLLVFLFNERESFNSLFSENMTELPESFKTDHSADSLFTTELTENTKNKDDSLQKPDANPVMANEQALTTFFTKLGTTHDTLVRIVYYGDSQIERDFITHTFRKKLQHHFGGAGPGYVPAGMYFNKAEGVDIVSNDFESHSLSYQNGNDNFALYGRYFVATGNRVRLKIKNRKAENFRCLKLFYHGNGKLNIQDDEDGPVFFTLNDSLDNLFTNCFGASPGTLRLSIESDSSFLIDGLLLDPIKGLVVDQVAFRGNLNLMAHKINGDRYLNMAHKMNIGLFILHFGLNAIPDQRSSYSAYQKALERDISLLKLWVPDASVLVIGASDMAYRFEGELKPYPNIDALIEAQRKAAFSQGAAFWDMRAAMGGKGSIVQWVEAQQARSDYAHLTQKGGEIIGEHLYLDLMKAYNQYLEHDD
ncbi:SGNH/GDSL hydrolase family protein [Roseimarinus sediminis]|uniref:hypothetical protein n=1 Tax=Roseimarinus sediminis TaxID=1610899 RepID=UPI003D197FD9